MAMTFHASGTRSRDKRLPLVVAASAACQILQTEALERNYFEMRIGVPLLTAANNR